MILQLNGALQQLIMAKLCKVIYLFHTQIGLILFIGVFDDFMPKIGDSFLDHEKKEWKIVGKGSNKIYKLSENSINNERIHDIEKVRKYDLSKFKAVYDCVVIPVGHSGTIKINDDVTFPKVSK